MNSASQNSTTTPENQPRLQLTCFNSTSPARLSKRFTLKNGALQAEGGGNMTAGTAERLTLNLADFAALLPTLKPSQACSYGVAGYDAARVVVADAVPTAPPGNRPTIARTRDFFTWPDGAGILMLDHDAPEDDAQLLDCQQLRVALAIACPALATAPAVWRPSASSCIHVKSGAELRGVRGQRLYLPVMDASDIERAGKVLFDRLWLAGYGRYELSGSGAWLARGPIDASVFQPERLDFCGGAAVGAGLEQRLPTPVIFNPDAPYLDSRAALPDLSADEQARLAELREAAKTPELVAEQAGIKEAWIGRRVDQHLATMPEPKRAAARPRLTATYRQAVEGGRLAADFELTVKPKGGTTATRITVADALADKAAWHEATCLDPLEPDYPDGAGRFVGWLNLVHKPPYISSRAHGGIRYELTEPAAAEPEPPDWLDDAPPIEEDPGKPLPATDSTPLLVKGKTLLKHNDAAALLFEKEFGGRLFYDPIQLDWFEYRPAAGVFEKRPGLAIEKAVYQAINRHRGTLGFDTSYVSGVTKCLLYEAVAQPKPVVGKICFTNGVLDLATRELLPHSPDYYFTSSLPFPWNPDAPEPTLFLEWLRAAVSGHEDQVQLLRAYLNAVVVGRPDLQRFLELIGAAGSGKGTFIRTAQALVGKGGSHPTRLKELEENRFETANLFGKRLVVIGDAEKWNGSIDVLKGITGQDSIRFEQKHKQGGEDFVFGGMVIVAGNQHTNSTDYSSGIQRRKITVPFDYVVPASARRELDVEFEPLLPDILKWVLDMPQREVTAYLRNTSTQAASLKAARLEALAATNPLAAWMLDNVHFAENVSAQVGEKKRLAIAAKDGYGDTVTRVEYEHENARLYPNYCRWCDQNSKMPVSKNLFSSTVIDVAKNLLNKSFVERVRDGSGARCIRGMTLTAPTGKPAEPEQAWRPTGNPPPDSDNSRQPSDNLLTTQVIESDEGIYLEGFPEVNNYFGEKAPYEQNRAAFEVDEIADEKNVEAESGETCGENASGCHLHQNQDVRLSEGCQKVVVGCQVVSGLPGDAARLADVLKLFRGAETDKRLARKMGWSVSRLAGAAGVLATAGLAEVHGEMIRPAGRLVAAGGSGAPSAM